MMAPRRLFLPDKQGMCLPMRRPDVCLKQPSVVVARSYKSTNKTDSTGESPICGNVRLWSAIAAAVLSVQTSVVSPAPCWAHTPYSVIDAEAVERLQLPPLPTEFPTLPLLRPARFERFTLSNGLRVIMLEDHEAPLVRGFMVMRGGERASPADKIGLGTVATAVQRSGGSVAHPENVLDEELDELSASIEGGAGPETSTLGFSCLTEDVTRVMSLFGEVLTSPAVPDAKVELVKRQALNAVAHRNDNPTAIPSREAAKLIYGAGSPYAREPTVGQLQTVTKSDIKSWLKTWQRPDTAVLGIVGDFTARDMKSLVQTTFASWNCDHDSDAGQTQPPPPLPTPPLPNSENIAGRVFLVDVPGSTQTSVAVVEQGIRYGDPDEVALDVLGDLLNSFGGRLFDEIRSREGLAYSVAAGWQSAPLDHEGLFIATSQTAQPAPLLVALHEVFQDVIAAEPSLEEFKRAQEESVNSFVFQFSSNLVQLRRAAGLELFGLPEDYVIQYRKKLEAVTPSDVRDAAARHLHPNRQVTVLVGDATTVKPAVEEALGVRIEPLRMSPLG